MGLLLHIQGCECAVFRYKVIAFRVCGDGIVRRIAHPNIVDIFRVLP